MILLWEVEKIGESIYPYIINTEENEFFYKYFDRLAMQNIKAQSYSNKLQAISVFLRYLQVTDYISDFFNPVALYYKKSYPTINEIDQLDQKLDLLTAHLGEFPEQLR